MKTILRIVLIALLTYFLSAFMPWWVCAVFAFLVCFGLPSSMLNAFIVGFLGVGLVWISQAWTLDVANNSNFSTLIAQIMKLDNPFLLILITGAIGALVGGFGAMSGASLRHIFMKPVKKGMYH